MLDEAGLSFPEIVDLCDMMVVLSGELCPLSFHLKSNQELFSVTREVEVVKRLKRMTVFVKVSVILEGQTREMRCRMKRNVIKDLTILTGS